MAAAASEQHPQTTPAASAAEPAFPNFNCTCSRVFVHAHGFQILTSFFLFTEDSTVPGSAVTEAEPAVCGCLGPDAVPIHGG